MDGNKHISSAGKRSNNEVSKDEKAAIVSVISIEQLRRLVRLLDSSNISELELRRAEEGTHLVLRKAKVPESANSQTAVPVVPIPAVPLEPPTEKIHDVVAPLVGTFHTWLKPKGGALVAVGDCVKAGQLVGTIESLNMLNEVETGVAGRVVEIFVQEGQPVEYGQVLMTIESTEEK
jgi:acetyl-CoA carboxylase biotin carboxyl carrier protein